MASPVDIKAVFRRLDASGDGFISRGELEDVLRTMCKMTELQIEQLFHAIDINQNGSIAYEEFVDWICGNASATSEDDKEKQLLDHSAEMLMKQ
mmetsp:Transcript_6588/g.10561  ORF Transcript_6588/g.10561 Transcript_6588/m.10561 type:complete len:94 (+) Transcript_6588:60-341(+)